MPSITTHSARISAEDRNFEDWQKRTGEQAPDFDAMPSRPFLPDPLEGVKTREQWAKRRVEIRALFEKWVFGKMPPKPDNLRAVVTDSRQEGGVTVRDVRLEFGPDHKGILHLQLVIPPGKGPFPVFLTNHPRTRPWIVPAVRRGYIGCIYFAADPRYGAPDDSEKFTEIYREYEFPAMARWAWSGMRAVDYLVSLPEVDRARIGISGHSRNGKQALIAAAMDERIAAAVPSSGNTGEGNAWRYTTDRFVNETIEQITSLAPGWFHPRLRFFAGREHKLPVDQNELMALVAPRGLLLASAYSEGQGAPFGFEQVYRSVRKVYQFLGADSKLGLSLRGGEHATVAEDIEQYVDFFDSVFGRSTRPVVRNEVMPKIPVMRGVPLPAAGASVRDRMNWVLGEAPPEVVFPAGKKLQTAAMVTDGWLGTLYERPLAGRGFKAYILPFGDDLKGDVYVPDPMPAAKLPVVIWLHPYSHPTGYSRGFKPTVELLTRMGYAVVAFDQIGYGYRLPQAARFYERYPKWSLLGKMVSDTRAAVDAVAAIESFDASRISLAGWALGGKVALWTAAFEPRVSAVIAASGFTPLRTATKDVEGVAEYTELYGLAPRLKSGIPVDYDEILKAIAPRPVLIRAPQFDRYAVPEQVNRVAREAGPHITLTTPVDFQRFDLDARREAFEWLKGK